MSFTQTNPQTADLFQEDEKSPRESHGGNGFKAARILYVPAFRKQEALGKLLGTGLGTGATNFSATYPGYPGVVVDNVDINPFTVTPDERSDMNPETEYNTFNTGFLRFDVSYKIISARLPDLPEVDAGYLTYERSHSQEAVIIPARDLIKEAEEEEPEVPLDEEQDKVVYESIVDHIFEWSNVMYPPFKAISDLSGLTNNGAFFGKEEQTLLFMGDNSSITAMVNPTQATNLAAVLEPERYWRLRYVFRERRKIDIVQGQREFKGGWNVEYDRKEKVWKRVFLSNGLAPYPDDDFSPLFKQEVPPAGDDA